MFRPSSRHLRCPSCRARDVCACGRSKQVKSATCGMCRSVSAEANGNWRGGRTRHKAGDVMVRLPGHPRATSGRYVFEHILVAEELLGRYLLDGETIHHRNGVRDDNRPENLELWTTPQPSGIRVATQSIGHTPSLSGIRASAHLQRCSRSRVSILGGGGNRTVKAPFLEALANATFVTLPAKSVGPGGTRWHRMGRAGIRCCRDCRVRSVS